MQAIGAVDDIQASFNHTLSKLAVRRPSTTNKGKLLGGVKMSRNPGKTGKKKVTHSVEVFESEFSRVFERKEYTQARIEFFYQNMHTFDQNTYSLSDINFVNNNSSFNALSTPKSHSDTSKLCHCCRKWEIPERSILSRMFNNESDSALYCHFCMKRVCSIECVYDEQFVIPRLFNVAYDLSPH